MHSRFFHHDLWCAPPPPGRQRTAYNNAVYDATDADASDADAECPIHFARCYCVPGNACGKSAAAALFLVFEM